MKCARFEGSRRPSRGRSFGIGSAVGAVADGLLVAIAAAVMVAPVSAQDGGKSGPPPAQDGGKSGPAPAPPPQEGGKSGPAPAPAPAPTTPPPATPPPAQQPQTPPTTPTPQAPVAPPPRLTQGQGRGFEVVAGQPGGPVGLAVPGLSRASNLLGAPVLDSLDELLGSVEDIVIDPEDGRIQYVAVAAAPNASRGAGGGERLLALPPDLLRSGPEHTVVVNVTKAELSKAAAFSPSAWPNAADREWIAGAWRPFGLSPYWTVPPSVTAVRPPEVRSPDAPQPPAWRGERVSALLNEPVRNPEGGDLGAVQDLVFNMLNQRVAFAIVTPADSIDLADRLLAVPWRATAQSRSQLVVAIDESEAHRAPGFSPDAWPNMNDVQWLNEVNGFFKDRPAAQPRTRRVQSG